MVLRSKFADLDIPKCNLLTYLFSEDGGKNQPTGPLWMDAANPSHSISPAQMVTWIKRLASGLDKLGIPKQATVMVFSPNHLYVPVAYLAAAGSQRIFTGANPTYTTSEVAFQMQQIEAAILLVHPSLLETGLAAAKQAGLPFERVLQFGSEECKTSAQGIRDWRSILASESEAQSWTWDNLAAGNVAAKTIASVNFSSGTTGLPKGTCITHYNLVSNVAQTIFIRLVGTPYSLERPNPNERWLAFLPLYHAYSQLWTITIACKLRVPVYVMAKFEFEPFLKYIEKYRINALQAAPPVLVMLNKRPETSKYNLSSIDHILCGAAPLSKELQNDISSKLGCVVAQGWGMTETTCAVTITPGNTHDDSGSVGCLMPNSEARLVDDNEQDVTGEGAMGELLVRGPQIMQGYWRNEKATQESLDDQGWFKTGDVSLYKDGKFWIVDRKKELIKVNGLQVAPAELEALLLENEDVADAAVVGIVVHHEELPRAYVVRQDRAKGTVSEKDIQDFVAKRVAKHKRLKGGVKFVDEVPKLPSGKIVRKIMKEWAKRDAKEVEAHTKARL